MGTFFPGSQFLAPIRGGQTSLHIAPRKPYNFLQARQLSYCTLQKLNLDINPAVTAWTIEHNAQVIWFLIIWNLSHNANQRYARLQSADNMNIVNTSLIGKLH